MEKIKAFQAITKHLTDVQLLCQPFLFTIQSSTDLYWSCITPIGGEREGRELRKHNEQASINYSLESPCKLHCHSSCPHSQIFPADLTWNTVTLCTASSNLQVTCKLQIRKV